MKGSNRTQKLSYLIGFLDMLAVGLFIPLFPQYARQLGISAFNIGLFGSIYGFLQFFSSPIVGGYGDKLGKITVLVKCLLLVSLGYFIMGAGNTVWFIFVSRLFTGCFKHTQSLTKAFLADVTEDSKHHEVFGFQSSISNLGFIIGPSLSGMIAELENGFQIATMLGASIFLLMALIVFFFLDDQPIQGGLNEGAKKTKGDIWSNLKAILAKPGLRDVFVIQFLISASSLLFRENASLLLYSRYQTSAKSIGFMISFANFVSSMSGFFVARLAKFYGNDDSQLLLHCTYVHVLAILASTFAPAFWIYNFCLVPYKLAQAVTRVAIMNLLVTMSEGAASGELMGSSQSIFAISRILAPFVCGMLQEISVLVPGFLAGVLGMLMIPSIYRTSVKTKRSS